MKKINLKKAYTMTEVVVVMIIIGIIVGITLQITASKVDKADKYMYYATYTALTDLTRELLADNVNMQTLGGSGTGKLCNQFQTRFNISEQKLIVNGSEVTPSCTINHSITNSTDFAKLTPNIVLRNGIKFYNLNGSLVTISQLNGATDVEKNGYIVYADIDAERSSGVLYNDVFPFYITVSGRVIPAYPTSGNAGGNNTDDIMFSVRYDEITADKRRIEHWLVKSVSFKEAACKSGYIKSTTYCSGSDFALDAHCTATDSNCVLVPVTPIKYMVK